MSNELRKNPRFVSAEGIAASLIVEDREWAGILQNFSSSGFAVLISEKPDVAENTLVEIRFSPPETAELLNFTATISNRKEEGDHVRLGCLITDMRGQSEAYLSFLTRMMFSQGMLRSMATKPVKCRPATPG